MNSRFALLIMTVCLVGHTVSPALAKGELKPNKHSYEFDGKLEYTKKDDDGKPDKDKTDFDVSGIACVELKNDKKRCLIINDEGSEAQFVKIDDRTIEPGDRIELLDGFPQKKPSGVLPNPVSCTGGTSGDVEFDGEAVAYGKEDDQGYFYVVGSHGCGRKRKAFKSSSMVLARIAVDEKGKPAGSVETTFRLGQALAAGPTVGKFVLRDLKEGTDGLNVEGLAVIGKRLFVGLRAPNLNRAATIVVVPLDGLFATGNSPFSGAVDELQIEIGESAGIRDLSVTEDGRLLVVTGPAQEQPDVPASLYLVDADGKHLRLLAELDDLKDEERGGKAEAAIPIGKDRVLVLFDGLKNGGPREYDVPLK